MSIIEDKHKRDAGKAPISLVPPAIIWDIAEVRDYGLPHRSLAACELSFFCQKARGKE